jgi:hypothetical protein
MGLLYLAIRAEEFAENIAFFTFEATFQVEEFYLVFCMGVKLGR